MKKMILAMAAVFALMPFTTVYAQDLESQLEQRLTLLEQREAELAAREARLAELEARLLEIEARQANTVTNNPNTSNPNWDAWMQQRAAGNWGPGWCWDADGNWIGPAEWCWRWNADGTFNDSWGGGRGRGGMRW